MTFFASAACDADEGAHWVGVLAGAIASFAFTEFFVLTTHLRTAMHEHDFGSWHAASFRMNAHTIFVFQESGFSEATDNAIASADRARVWFGAGGWAGCSASEENFVFFALRHFWWIGEELHRFWLNLSSAFAGLNTFSGIRSEMTLFASAAWDADTWADRVGVLAGTIASFALTEFFVLTAHLSFHWHDFGS